MTTTDYQKGLAAGMDQPPFDLSVVESADVIAPYKKLCGWFADTVKRAPEPIVRNPQVAKVQAAQKPVSPHLGDIVQGYLGGDVKDLKAALRDLNARSSADRDQAIAAATAGGAQVSLADYAFADWQPGQDWVRPA